MERSPSLAIDKAGPGAIAPSTDAFATLAQSAAQEWPPLRCTPSLKAPQGPLVDFLTGGYGYDDQSVAAAVKQGNEHFDNRELLKAIDFFGAAYEIGRLHFDYKPLMHDLVLRRIICFSMLGDLDQALHEHELSLRVIPHSATSLLMAGVVYSKLGDADSANRSFQHAVAQSRELRDLIDCIVATFMLTQGHNDRAIQITSQVLVRRPGYAFALLVRGDAYKFHASGYFARQAADDYTALMNIDASLQELSGERLTQQQHYRLDELVLRFHPRLQMEGPRAYDQYPMCAVYRKRRPFLTSAFVLFATAKLKTYVRSTQLVKNVQKRNEELLKARAEAERKVRQLAETQQRLAAVESSSFSEVWGPADPDHCHVRKYRRYWMERPLGFPKRGGVNAAVEDGTPPHSRSPSPTQMLKEARNSITASQAAQASPPPIPTSVGRSPLPEHLAPALLFSQPGAGSSPRPSSAPSLGPSPGPAAPATGGELRRFAVPPPAAGAMGPAAYADEADEAEAAAMKAADLLLASEEPSTPPHPTAKKMSQERTYLEKPPLQKLGHDWNERQWLAKALELADRFSQGGTAVHVDGQLPMALAQREGCAAEVAASLLRGRPGERQPGAQRAVSPVPTAAATAVLRVPTADGQGCQANLTDAIEEFGFDVIPNWFTSLDRIYEVSEMDAYRNGPENLAAAPGLAGAPGYSYVVPKNQAARERPRSAKATGEQNSPPRRAAGQQYTSSESVQPDEAVSMRYKNRLLASSPPGRVAAVAH